ncbi:PREDICTED: vomeronasal type-1 receptor 96-like [Galeopterus variegatus]|uniref:Vomeronasal type-1 receptor n=1 Tax=Galeopterus variegatus TaxID=482537 RepID=A0ABM0RHV4_GALVR|nr:PREDICTED: vomeronasal type-1 receptor 96-like [Galeopterus variegatus]
MWAIISTVATSNSTEVGLVYSLMNYKTRQFTYHHAMLFLSAMFLQDFLFLSLIIWTIFYMVLILFRYHKAILHIHGTSLSPRSSERKETHVVRLLVSCFVFFHGTNLRLSIYMCSKYNNNLMMENIFNFLSSSYPTICALMFINSDKRISRLTCAISNMSISHCSLQTFLLHQRNPDQNFFNYKKTCF